MDFMQHCQKIKQNGFKTPLAYGIAKLYKGQLSNEVVSLAFSNVNYKENENFYAVVYDVLGLEKYKESDEFFVNLSKNDLEKIINVFKDCGFGFDENSLQGHENLKTLFFAYENSDTSDFALVVINDDVKPTNIYSAYLKLHLISSHLPPHSLKLDGVFGLLKNLAWSENKPYELEYLRQNKAKLLFSDSYPKIDFVDKFPRYLSRIVPDESVRILDDSKVRFGAHIAPKTTIMPGASYVNFNAGTLGAVMVEGRISSAARVGDGSDVGGGASILGVLSGTSGTPISVAKRCLLGANSVTGISLGDDCVVDAGIAVLEGSKISISDDDLNLIKQANKNADFEGVKSNNKTIIKAKNLSGLNAIHFRQDSINGGLVAKFNTKAVKLNEDLH